MSDGVSFNIIGLENLIKAFSGRMPTIKVGILGDGGARSGTGKGAQQTNAQVGLRHEHGAIDAKRNWILPQRSFLRMPLTEHLEPALEASGAFDQAVLDDVIRSGDVKPWADKIAVVAEGVVLTAFDTGGYGQWAPLAPSTLRRKKVQQILVETQQLRNSITSEVK